MYRVEACGRSILRSILVNNSVKWVLNSVNWVLNTVKRVLNTVKPVMNRPQTQSNGRVNLINQYKPVWDPEYAMCSYTPRFSYEVPKTAVRACPGGSTGTAVSSSAVQGGYTGGYRGGVYRVGNTRYPAAEVPLLEEQALTAKRAPDHPAGVGSGWSGCSGRLGPTPWCASGLLTTHSGPMGLRGPLRCQEPSLRAKGEIR